MPAPIDPAILQPPKGTRDFYPANLAVRRHLERIWRDVSTRHGFDEIEGPTFEHLDLYTIKSGEGIVNELFSFRRAGGERDYALRPEFTPTLARMVAARAAQLPKPIKWFTIPTHFRAERPQRGRLREFVQWNVDMLGDETPAADAEIIGVAIESLRAMGLTSKDVTVRLSHRGLVVDALEAAGVAPTDVERAMSLLDRRAKIDAKEFRRHAEEVDLDVDRFEAAMRSIADRVNRAIARAEEGEPATEEDVDAPPAVASVLTLLALLAEADHLRWCEFDPSIVRGLAYYTGTVFEIHEATGKERAIAGGGRYDRLVELFGGPPTPAVGFAMGDVVVRLVLEDKGLLEPAEAYLPRPDVFVISTGSAEAQAKLRPIVADLRREGLHVRHTHRATRNLGKLLGEANKARARLALILGDELARDRAQLKNLATGAQRPVPLASLAAEVRRELDAPAAPPSPE